MTETVFRGGTILTIDPSHRVLAGDVAIVDGIVTHVGGPYTPQSQRTSRSSIAPAAS